MDMISKKAIDLFIKNELFMRMLLEIQSKLQLENYSHMIFFKNGDMSHPDNVNILNIKASAYFKSVIIVTL